jgi:anti-sigma factor RsiW
MTDKVESRRRVMELLPFYVNGSLSSEERAGVETLLAVDEDARRQHDQLVGLRQAIKVDDTGSSPAEFGLARLKSAIDRDRNRPAGRWQGLVAATIAGLVVAGAIAYAVLPGRGPVYVQAGATLGQPLLVIAFRPDAPQGAVSELLIDNDVVIVDGPSAVGLYRAALPKARSRDEVLQALRSASRLVESVGIDE